MAMNLSSRVVPLSQMSFIYPGLPENIFTALAVIVSKAINLRFSDAIFNLLSTWLSLILLNFGI